MNNLNAQTAINDFNLELNKLEILIQSCGSTSDLAKYLTRYSLMRACGVVEYSFKTIIADYHTGLSPKMTNFLNVKLRDNSSNPSYQNILRTLKDFDDIWHNSFKQLVNSHPDKDRILRSLDSLNENRNSFAHGKNPTASILDIKQYYQDSLEILYQLDQAVV